VLTSKRMPSCMHGRVFVCTRCDFEYTQPTRWRDRDFTRTLGAIAFMHASKFDSVASLDARDGYDIAAMNHVDSLMQKLNIPHLNTVLI
jgi:hypothetical protein